MVTLVRYSCDVLGLTRMIDDLLTLLQDAKKTISSADVSDPVKVKYTLKQLSKDAVLGE